MHDFTVDSSVRCSWQREKGAARCWALARQCVLALSLTIACQSAPPQAMYRIKPLGSPRDCSFYGWPARVVGFNEAGQMAGTAKCALRLGTVSKRTFLWKNNGTPMVDLGPPEVGSVSYGAGINASGLVTGDAQDSTGEFAFLSSGDGTPMRRIYDVFGGSQIYPAAINDLGQLTGLADLAGDVAYHAFVWKNDGTPMRDLGTLGGDSSLGSAINASGQVAGRAEVIPGTKNTHAFIWKNDGTPMLDLGTLGGDYAGATFINASGQTAGESCTVQSTPCHAHAFFWRNDGTPMQDLGTLDLGTLGRGVESDVSAFNNSGQIAGISYTNGNANRRAFVWMNDGTPMKDLGTFGGADSYATDINASGQVTGTAYLAGNAVYRAFLWRNDGTKIHDLNTLIDPTDPLKPYVTLTNGYFINDRGDILAHGVDSRMGTSGLYVLQGTVLTLSPHSLAFGNRPIHTASAAKSVTLTNTSAKVVAITSIALTGSGSGQFASTNNCGNSLVGHATCAIKVTFKPTTKGAKTAFVKVNGGSSGLTSIKLTGTGT